MREGINKKRVLFLCTGNSCRSQMSEGFLRAFAGNEFDVCSAGMSPTSVHPMAIQVMSEAAIDISSQRSKAVDEMYGREFDYVVTVCDRARDVCPIFPGDVTSLHWSFEDPAEATGTEEERLNVFRRVRDEIAENVRAFAGVRPGVNLTSVSMHALPDEKLYDEQ